MGATGSKLEKALGDQFPEGECYFGLENFGNTCYCNSVLQALYFCVPFREQLLELYADSKNSVETEENLMTCLADLFLQADLEEAKAQEIARLERALEEMKMKIQESKATLDNECEAVKKTVVDKHSQQEVMNKLADENEQLKDLVTSLENLVDETTKLSEKRSKKAQEAESKIVEPKTDMKRLEEKISNMESENRNQYQSKLTSSTGKKSV